MDTEPFVPVDVDPDAPLSVSHAVDVVESIADWIAHADRRVRRMDEERGELFPGLTDAELVIADLRRVVRTLTDR